MRTKGIALPVFLVAASLGLAGCGGGSDGDTAAKTAASEPGTEATLVDVTSVDSLRARFNADAGRPRLLLIFSPT